MEFEPAITSRMRERILHFTISYTEAGFDGLRAASISAA